ncbi:MAG: cytochrome c3 family protein [Deltaproteobacteria bacterium]|nr:cytochrome c3 family protein [Deltaproteobacteria bacterium]
MKTPIFFVFAFFVSSLILLGRPLYTKGPDYPVPYPPFSPGIFPCMSCHESLERNKKPRQLKDMHSEIKLRHGERWCYDCHSESNLDNLKLAGGDQIPFQRSYELCGQCHGNVLKDWKKGIHGKRTGLWQGRKQYLLCVHCHDPHTPGFKALKPDPAPVDPGRTLRKRGKNGER